MPYITQLLLPRRDNLGRAFGEGEYFAVSTSTPSALITDNGRRILLRINGRFYQLSHDELRAVLGLSAGLPGLGITVNHDRLRFEFAADNRIIELSAARLGQRLKKLSSHANR